MKKFLSSAISATMAVAFVAAAIVAADQALKAEALEECLSFEEEARTFGDVTVPEWCAQVPRP
jgi:hypothetical protein